MSHDVLTSCEGSKGASPPGSIVFGEGISPTGERKMTCEHRWQNRKKTAFFASGKE